MKSEVSPAITPLKIWRYEKDKSIMLGFRVNKDTYFRIEELSKVIKRSRSDVLRNAVELYLDVLKILGEEELDIDKAMSLIFNSIRLYRKMNLFSRDLISLLEKYRLINNVSFKDLEASSLRY